MLRALLLVLVGLFGASAFLTNPTLGVALGTSFEVSSTAVHGRGDYRTKKGKRFKHSNGVQRPNTNEMKKKKAAYLASLGDAPPAAAAGEESD
ncbi:unnamed protein product [Chrysoparadoxa australica]